MTVGRAASSSPVVPGRPGAPARGAGTTRPCAGRHRSPCTRTLPSSRRSSSVGSSSSASAWSAWVATTTRSNRCAAPSSVRSSTPSGAAPDAAHRRPVRTPPEPLGDRVDVRPAPARDACASESGRSRASRGCRRTGSRSAAGNSSARAGRGRPERGGERDEEVAAEALRVAVLVEVAAERPAVQILLVERPAGGAQPAADLPEEPVEAGARRVPRLRERPAARVLEPAVAAADRERHVRLLRRGPRARGRDGRAAGSSARCGRGSRCRARDRRRTTVLTCPPAPRLSLEDLDLVRAREHVRGAEAGDAAAHHCHPHHVGSSLRRSSCVADGIFTFQTRRSFSSARITHQETSSCRRPSPCRADAGNA